VIDAEKDKNSDLLAVKICILDYLKTKRGNWSFCTFNNLGKVINVIDGVVQT
jgi:hypothetical protein